MLFGTPYTHLMNAQESLRMRAIPCSIWTPDRIQTVFARGSLCADISEHLECVCMQKLVRDPGSAFRVHLHAIPCVQSTMCTCMRRVFWVCDIQAGNHKWKDRNHKWKGRNDFFCCLNVSRISTQRLQELGSTNIDVPQPKRQERQITVLSPTPASVRQKSYLILIKLVWKILLNWCPSSFERFLAFFSWKSDKFVSKPCEIWH